MRFLAVVAAVPSTTVGRRAVRGHRARRSARPAARAPEARARSSVPASYVLAPLSPAELDEAIVQPAARVGVTFDDGVVADLIAEAVDHPGSLPLLQFTLTELYDRRVDGVIGRDALDADRRHGRCDRPARRGGLRRSRRADQSEARELFGRLVAPGRGHPTRVGGRGSASCRRGCGAVADAFRRRPGCSSPTAIRPRAKPTIEVAHEALLDPVVAARRIGSHEDRRWLAQLQHLVERARAGMTAAVTTPSSTGGAAGGGDRGARRRRPRGVRPRARVRRSRSSGPRRRDRRRSANRTAAAATAHRRRRRARRRPRRRSGGARATRRRARRARPNEAEIEALVGRAESLRGTQRDAAALLAVEAYRLADTPRTRSALFGTFTDDERFLDAHRFEGDRGTSGIVMPDGASAFLTDQAGRLHAYDLDTGALGPLSRRSVTATRSRCSPRRADGGRLALACRADSAVGPTSVGVYRHGRRDAGVRAASSSTVRSRRSCSFPTRPARPGDRRGGTPRRARRRHRGRDGFRAGRDRAGGRCDLDDGPGRGDRRPSTTPRPPPSRSPVTSCCWAPPDGSVRVGCRQPRSTANAGARRGDGVEPVAARRRNAW